MLTMQYLPLLEPCRSHLLHLRMACPRPPGPLCGLHHPYMGDTRDRDLPAVRWADGL